MTKLTTSLNENVLRGVEGIYRDVLEHVKTIGHESERANSITWWMGG
jgi:hypothetical protein